MNTPVYQASFPPSHVNMAQVQPANPPQEMNSIDYIHLYYSHMKNIPKLGLFSDYSEMEALLKEKIAKKGSSNVNTEQPRSSVSAPIARRTKKRKKSTFYAGGPTENCEGVAGPSKQLHGTSGDLDAEMRGDELIPTHTPSFSPPAFNTRKGKERAVETNSNTFSTLCATQGSSSMRMRCDGSASPPRAPSSRTKCRKIEIEDSDSLPTPSVATVTIDDATQDYVEQESDLYTILIDRKGKKIRQCNTHPEIRTDSKGDMDRHLECLDHQGHSYHCVPECGKSFTRKDPLVRHIKKRHKRDGIVLNRNAKFAVWK